MTDLNFYILLPAILSKKPIHLLIHAITVYIRRGGGGGVGADCRGFLNAAVWFRMVQKRKNPPSSSSVVRNALLIREVRGEQAE